MDEKQREDELVALSAATVFVYRQVMGRGLETSESSDTAQVLHDVAHALSNIAPIYAARADSEPLAPVLLMDGVFQLGAKVLRTSKGIEYRRLAIRRDDMVNAVEILKRAGARFELSQR